jgi:hypothetical protein
MIAPHQRIGEAVTFPQVRARARTAIAFGVLASACGLVACSDEGTYYSPEFTVTRDLPRGMIVGAGEQHAPVVGGVYRDNSPSCCWTAPHAVIRVEKRPGDRELYLSIFLPRSKTFMTTPQRITARVGGGPPLHGCCYGPGASDVVLKLPARSWPLSGAVTVELTTGIVYIPKNDGYNADSRRLGVLLRQIGFRA